jgi:hypothetical protein
VGAGRQGPASHGHLYRVLRGARRRRLVAVLCIDVPEN